MAPASPPLDDLTEPVSETSPSGEDAAYSPDYLAMEQLAEARQEQQFGDVVVDATAPAWTDLASAAAALASRTHDLRVGIHLSHALLNTRGIAGFADGLDVLSAWLDREWDTLHPALDPDDGEEAIERSNIVLGLCDPVRAIKALEAAPIATASGLGSCSLRDVRRAHDDAESDKPRLGLHELHALFIAAKRSDLRTLRNDLDRCRASLKQIIASFADRTGFAPNLTTAAKTIDEIDRVILEMMPDGLSEPPTPAKDTALEEPAMSVTTIPPQTEQQQASPAMATSGGFEIRSRSEVVAALDAICRYYAANEPSSPVPLLVQRAQPLVTMDFIDILRTLSPDSLNELSRWVAPGDD